MRRTRNKALAPPGSRGHFTDLRDLLHRTHLPKSLIANLIRAGALDGVGSRRALLWALGPLEERTDGLDGSAPLGALEQTLWEYELLGHAPDGQLLRHYRAAPREAGILSTWQVKQESKGGPAHPSGGDGGGTPAPADGQGHPVPIAGR